MTLRLLDLFCGAGGAGMGYHRAGFEVVGVDIDPQPHYPFEFHQADALTFPLDGFDAIHASPPCQAFTRYQNLGPGHVRETPNLIPDMRGRLTDWGGPWVIENVPGAPLIDPVMICGTMFDPPMEVQRHRLFESNWGLAPPAWPCRHKLNGPNRYPGGNIARRRGGPRSTPIRRTVEIGSWSIPLEVQQRAMGVDWTTLEELSESIPPAYTEFIGTQLAAHLQAFAPR